MYSSVSTYSKICVSAQREKDSVILHVSVHSWAVRIFLVFMTLERTHFSHTLHTNSAMGNTPMFISHP